MEVALEIIGSAAGIAGALLMVISPEELARLAFPIWLLSTILLAIFAQINKMRYLLTLQLAFMVINFYGVLIHTFGFQV